MRRPALVRQGDVSTLDERQPNNTSEDATVRATTSSTSLKVIDWVENRFLVIVAQESLHPVRQSSLLAALGSHEWVFSPARRQFTAQVLQQVQHEVCVVDHTRTESRQFEQRVEPAPAKSASGFHEHGVVAHVSLDGLEDLKDVLGGFDFQRGVPEVFEGFLTEVWREVLVGRDAHDEPESPRLVVAHDHWEGVEPADQAFQCARVVVFELDGGLVAFL